MKRLVVVMTVWAMGLAGVLAGVVFPSSTSAAPTVAAATASSGSYTPLRTVRVFDKQVTTAQQQVQIAGMGGVPADATAVMVNTEVFAPTAAGYVRVTPAGQDAGVATQQFVKGQAISNLVAVKLVGGKVQVKVSAGSARVLMDVSGYYGGAAAGASFTPLPTARVFDKQVTTAQQQVQIAGKGGVPADATAVMVNTEVFAPTAAGYVRVTPAGQDAGVATQQFVKGQAVSNLVAVKLVGGKVQVKVSAGSARVLMDVSGYYGATAGASFTPLATARVFDGTATTAPRQVQIAGKGGVPADATAVMVNTEVFAPTAAGYVRVTPAGLDAGVATQQFVKGQAVSNLVAVKLVGGKVQVKVSAGSARVLMDVAGYYTAGDVAPGPVTALKADVVTNSSINLNWANPSDTDFTGVTIRRVEGATPPAWATAGTLVTDVAKPATSFTDTALTPGTQYSYALFAHNGTPTYAAAVKVTATTAVVWAVGATTLISARADGSEMAGYSYPGAVSSGGRYVAFRSGLPGAPQGGAFRRDTANGVTTLIAADTSATSSYVTAMSADGNQVLLTTSGYSGSELRFSAAVRDLAAGTSKPLNVTPANTAGNADIGGMALSADGRYAVFASNSTNLMPTSADGSWYVYQRDLQSGTTGLIGKFCTVDSLGNGCFSSGDMSSDGRFVAYTTEDPAGTNPWQVWLWDRAVGASVLVSKTAGGSPGDGQSWAPSVSDDGSRVVFTSTATSLVPNDINGESDVFVRNMMTGATTLVTQAPGGQQANGYSSEADISGDGSYVVFASTATNLLTSGPVANPTWRDEIYGRNLATGVTTLLSADPGGAPGNGDNDSPEGEGSWSPVLSSDGSAVAYRSNSSNIVPNTSFGPVNVLMRWLK